MEEFKFLEEQQVDPGLMEAAADFRLRYDVPEGEQNRVMRPPIPFYLEL